MTKFQRAYSVFFSLCLAGTLLFLPGPFFLPDHVSSGSGLAFFAENVYMRLPLYCYLERHAAGLPRVTDTETTDLLMRTEGTVPGDDAMQDTETQRTDENGKTGDVDVPDRMNADFAATDEAHEDFADEKTADKGEMSVVAEETDEADSDAENSQESGGGGTREVLAPVPKLQMSTARLSSFDSLMNQFYIVDENTATNAEQINALRFLAEDLSVKKDPEKPQILIYHSHSQEGFADSREGHAEDTVVGVGDYLTELLTEQYGYRVLHVTDTFDLFDGVLDRSRAYDAAREAITELLDDYPSIQVVIDLHRDGVPEDRHLVTKVNGKDTAQILFFNGLSYTRSQGAVSYLPNPYIQQNLAFSFQLEYLASQYFPDFPRGIYLAGLRYNLHLCPRALLLEAGAQTNTVQEVKNAMEPFAWILDMVLSGKQ